MKRLTCRFLTGLSTLLLLATLFACVLGLGDWVDPWEQYITVTHGLHVSVKHYGGESLPSLVAFSSSEAGPLTCVLTGIEIDGRIADLPDEEDIIWRPNWGCWWRYIREGEKTGWTLTVTLWYPLVAFAVLPGVWCVRRLTKRRGRLGSERT